MALAVFEKSFRVCMNASSVCVFLRCVYVFEYVCVCMCMYTYTARVCASIMATLVLPSWDEPDLVPGTRIVVQSLPPPLNGRCGKVVDYDRASRAYVVHVDGGNPRTIYRENLRIMEDQSTPVLPPKRQPGRPQSRARNVDVPSSNVSSSVRPGDQILLCVEQFQFTLMEVTGIRRVCKSEPHSYAIAAVLDDSDVPAWMRKPPPISAARPPQSHKGGVRVPGFRIGDPVYAVWDQDGRWYPGRIREDYGVEKFEIEWVDKEAAPSLVKKSLVCKRTTFDDLRNKPSYLGALNLASRTGGMRGLLKNANAQPEDDEEMDACADLLKREQAEAASKQLFGPAINGETTLTQDEWQTVVRGMRILGKFGIDGLINSSKKEVLQVAQKNLVPKNNETNLKKSVECDWESVEATNSLQAWLGEGGATVTPSGGTVRPPARATLEASISKTWNRQISLPRGPLDIFQRHTK